VQLLCLRLAGGLAGCRATGLLGDGATGAITLSTTSCRLSSNRRAWDVWAGQARRAGGQAGGQAGGGRQATRRGLWVIAACDG